MAEFVVPENLAAAAGRDADLGRWLPGLPAIAADLADRWSLRLGAPFEPGGQCSWVAPAGADLVLKVAFRSGSDEERDEAAGLRCWDGNGTVRLHAVWEGESARGLLLERCLPGAALGDVLAEPAQDEVVAALLRRLWAQPYAGSPFRPLAQMCAEWAQEFEREYAAAGPADRIDPGLARAGTQVLRSLAASADRQVLLCTDLHGENVLSAQREPWLVIDPKPYVGDPAYDVVQHMLCCDRLAADPAGLAARLAGLTGTDPGRVRLWLFARAVQESVGSPLLTDVARRLAP